MNILQHTQKSEKSLLQLTVLVSQLFLQNTVLFVSMLPFPRQQKNTKHYSDFFRHQYEQ